MPSKDWKGNNKSAFVCNGCSNHSSKEREKDDYYATSPVALEVLLNEGGVKLNGVIWECACGEGHLSKALEDNGYKVVSTDLVNRGYGISGIDFLEAKEMLNDSANILTNPPYKYAQEFVEHSLELLPEGGKCLMFLKLTFLEGKARKKLFRENPPKTVYVSSGRLQCAMNGDFEKYKKVGTAVAYAWYEWEKGYKGKTTVEWIN